MRYMIFGVDPKGEIDSFLGLTIQDEATLDLTNVKEEKKRMPANMLYGAIYPGYTSKNKQSGGRTVFYTRFIETGQNK